LEEKLAEYAKYITQMRRGILNRLDFAECQTHRVIDSHSSRLTEAKETILRLTAELEHTRKHFEAENQRMKEKLVRAQREHESAIKSITDELNKVQKQRDSHQAELLDLRSKFKTSTQMAAEAKAAAERLREKEAQSAASAAHSAELLAEAQQKASRHAARSTNLATVVGQLRGQFAEAEKNREETQELLKKVTEKSFNTESLLISAKRRCEALTTRVEELEIENEHLKGVIIGLEREVSRLKQTTSNACDNSENWQRECEKANTKVKELTAALISVSAQRESTAETEQVAELQAEIRALRQQTAEFAALQTEATEARAAEEADRLRVLRSCIEHELRPHLDSANERSDCLVKRVDALCQERDMLLLKLAEQQSMENEWESFLDGIGSLIDRLIGSVRHEEKVMKYEMAIQKTANEKLVQELKVDKVQIDNLTADRNALWRSLRERTSNVESWNRDMSRLQEELAEARKNLHSVSKERETALTSLRQVEQCLDQQKVAFCDRIMELETQVKSRECELQELKCRFDKRLSDLEVELARERMEKEALIAKEVCFDRGGGCGHDKATLGAEVEELRARLAERDAEVARLEVLSQDRAQLVEKRAAELADLQVGGR
uniref:Coiled-coil domain-containing protein 170 n=1 Tax=Taenia asiatica TaxID=60517 RepID=A0A158R886_TAEAS